MIQNSFLGHRHSVKLCLTRPYSSRPHLKTRLKNGQNSFVCLKRVLKVVLSCKWFVKFVVLSSLCIGKGFESQKNHINSSETFAMKNWPHYIKDGTAL